MHELVIAMREQGEDRPEILHALHERFPGLPTEDHYTTVMELALCVVRRRREPADEPQQRRRQPAPFVRMAPHLVAFAREQDFMCIYCERGGDHRAGPDAAAWCMDLLPDQHGGVPVLSCTKCKAEPGRAAKWEEAQQAEEAAAYGRI